MALFVFAKVRERERERQMTGFREEIFYWWVDGEISILLKTFSQVAFKILCIFINGLNLLDR
jgi:hypothetical protein